MADRRAGKGIPHVPSKGGAQPRARNKNGRWRKKRSDFGKTRNSSSKAQELFLLRFLRNLIGF